MTSMTNRTPSFVAPIVACALLVFSTGSLAAEPKPDQDIATLTNQFRNFAKAHGVEITAIQISKDIAAETEGNAGIAVKGCTASTEVARPDERGIALSAKGASCAQVVGLLKAGIAQYTLPTKTHP